MNGHKFLAGFYAPRGSGKQYALYRSRAIDFFWAGLLSQIKGCGCGGLRRIAS